MSTELAASASIFGVFAKVADFYGLRSADELLKRLNIKAPRKVQQYDWRLLEQLLSNALVKSDVNKFLPSIPVKKLISHRHKFAYSNPSNKTRVCRQCLVEGKLHQEKWQQLFYTHCELHHSPLVDGCNHIYADEFWPESMLCKHCFVQPKNTIVDCESDEVAKSSGEQSNDGSTTKALPDYFRHWIALRTAHERENFINHLYELANRMVRPFDFYRVKLGWQKLTVKQVTAVLEDAYRLGAVEQTADVWTTKILNRRSEIHSFGRVAKEHGLSELKSLLDSCDWPKQHLPDQTIVAIFDRYHQAVAPELYETRFHILKEDDGEALSMRVNSLHVKQLLDIDARALPELVDKSIIPVKKSSLRTDKLVFDIHDIDRAITKIFCFPVKDYTHTVSIDGVDQRILDTLLLDSKIATKHLLTGQLKGYLSVESTLSLINRSTLSAESIKHLFEYELAHRDHMDAVTVARLLNIRTSAVSLLVQHGFLQWTKWQRNGFSAVDIVSLRALLRDYVCVNREAILKRMKPENLVNQISACCGTAPTVDDVNFKDNVPLFLYKKSELNACCLSLAQNNLEALKQVGVDLSKKVRKFANAP